MVSRPPQPSWEQGPLFERERAVLARDAASTARAPVGAEDEEEEELAPLAEEKSADDAIDSRAEPATLEDELSDEDEEEELDEDEDEDSTDEEEEEDEDDSVRAEDDEDGEEFEDEDEEAEEDEDDDEDEAEEEDDESAELEEGSADEEGSEEDSLEEPAELEPANGSEAEVVLEPHPAPRPRRTGAATGRTSGPTEASRALSAPADHEELVLQAGMLFLQHGRVAVSLLQRHFGLDFDAACELLDELQQRGLIGPYLGGQRRDILLSAEQWMERVASS